MQEYINLRIQTNGRLRYSVLLLLLLLKSLAKCNGEQWTIASGNTLLKYLKIKNVYTYRIIAHGVA